MYEVDRDAPPRWLRDDDRGLSRRQDPCAAIGRAFFVLLPVSCTGMVREGSCASTRLQWRKNVSVIIDGIQVTVSRTLCFPEEGVL